MFFISSKFCKGVYVEKKILVLVIFLSFILSCNKVNSYYNTAKGNLTFSLGDYQSSNYIYLNLLEKNKKDSDYLYYNLGNVYFYLGESENALRAWDKINTENKKIEFNLNYNRGILFYQLGDYEKAFDNFKRALIIKPKSEETRKNIEMTVEKIESAIYSKKSKNFSKQSNKKSLSSDTQRVMKYAKRRETFRWSKDIEKTKEENQKDW